MVGASVLKSVLSLQADEAPQEFAEPQNAVEENEWQEYRPEDFGSIAGPLQPVHEVNEEEILQAALEASKAQAQAELVTHQQALLNFVNGHDSYAPVNGAVSNGPVLNGTSQHAASHRAWFPPADTFVSKASLHSTAEEEEFPEASPVTEAKASDDTYSDVMSFLLGS